MGYEAVTYAEKRSLRFGKVTERLGKDSLGWFGDCRLTLQPAADPVCTPSGIIYSKEAILQCLIQQREDIARKMQDWRSLQRKKNSKRAEWSRIREESDVIEFQNSKALKNY